MIGDLDSTRDLSVCRICAQPSPLWFTTNRPFHRCSSCFLLQTHALGAESDHEEFYQRHYGGGGECGPREEQRDQDRIWCGALLQAGQRLGKSARDLAVLDYGCGGGGAVSALRVAGADAWGVDPYLAERDASEHVLRGRATLLFPHASFDVVGAREVLEHLPSPWNDLYAIDHVLRKPGGLLFSVHLFESSLGSDQVAGDWYCADPTHVTFYSPEAIAAIVRRLQWRLLVLSRNVFLALK
ncbi:MAG: class I SAM-dependent methyltransferase [Candidatus Schekmanbacteria bacterium]|nr:class I SAM-dependent methyltransferase [Candidatus Schekmanbacteria bacterium]